MMRVNVETMTRKVACTVACVVMLALSPRAALGVAPAFESVATNTGTFGACCSPDLNLPDCLDGMSQLGCDDFGGAYRGDGSSCPADCPLCDFDPRPCDWCWEGTISENGCPPEWENDGECDCGCQFEDTLDCYGAVGACCDGKSGMCVDDVLEADCQTNQDTWYPKTLCSQVMCEPYTGACCMPDNTCEEIDVLVCVQQGGDPKGPGSLCMGIAACHFPDQTCEDMDAHCCLNKGGTPKAGESCLGVEACCMPDDTCEDIDALVCIQRGGNPQGPSSVCFDVSCHPECPSLTVAPEALCVTDPNGQVEVPILISGIQAAHPITGVTFNVEWDRNSCWQLCQPNDIEPVAPFEQLGEDTGPGYARFSAQIPSGWGITDPQAVAVLCFQVDLLNDCCVETLSLTKGPANWETKVTGLDVPPLIYVCNPILGPDQMVRLDAVAPAIKECVPDMFAKMDPGVCTWTPNPGEIVEPTWNENCEDCDATLTFERSDGVLLPLTAPFTSKKKVFIDWTIEDCCGNSVTCETLVLVEDNEAPVISPKTDKFLYPVDENCVWELPDIRGLVSITDNCMPPDPNVTQTPVEGTIWGPGEYDVSVNANDSNGNNSSGVYNINVTDQTPPFFTKMPEDIKVYADAGKCTANVSWEIGADDNCNWIKVICDYRSGSDFPLGSTKVTCTASDTADPSNTETYSFNLEVNPYWLLDVQVGLTGFMSKRGPFDRCVAFQLRDCVDGVLPSQNLNATLTFDGGVAMGTLEMPVDPLTCVEGSYSCARAKDIRYSLWSTVEDPMVSISGAVRMFVAIFMGDDALKLGDLNDSGYVDIEDWARWNHQFQGGFIPVIGSDPCDPKPNPADQLEQHADFNGDGFVTAVDFTHLFTNFADGDDLASRTAAVSAASDGPRMRISVAELRTAGMGSVAQYDSNHDGYVDVYEAGLSAPEASPVKPVAQPAGTRRFGTR